MANPKVLATNVEPIQVHIIPANYDLNYVMEIGYCAITANQLAPPNHWTNFLNPNYQLINMN